MLPRKFFENLRSVMAILVLFGQFLGQILLKFLPQILSSFPNMMHFIRTFRLMLPRRKDFCQ